MFAWRRLVLASLLALGLLLAASGRGSAITITGATLVDAPDVLKRDAFDLPDVIVFEERTGFTLTAALQVDGGVVIPKGTVVDVYYVVFDPAKRTHLTSSVTFDVDILGIASTTKVLKATDFLGNPDTTYGEFSHRGFESFRPGTSGRDSITRSANLRSIDFKVRANAPGDGVRVIVAHVVPEPGTLALVGLGCAGLALLGARRRAA